MKSPTMDHALNLPAAQALVSAPARPAPARAARAALPPPAQGAAQTLALPSVDQPWRYAWAYARAMLGSLVGPHRLRPLQAGHYAAPVQVSPRLARRWRAVFDVPARAAASVPLPAHQSVGLLLQARLFADLGLNRRHLRHLQHRSVHQASVACCAQALDQRLSCHVQRVLRLGEDRVLVQVHTQVACAAGEELSQSLDGFLVEGLPAADLAGLGSDSALLRELLGLRRRLPHLSTTAGNAVVCEMPVPSAMGWRYGRISGDMNPVHTSRLGAFVCGLKRPSLPELALRNLVLRHLAELGAPTARLELTFSRPAHLGQALLLVLDGAALEVHDAHGYLVAYGECGAAAAAAAAVDAVADVDADADAQGACAVAA